MSHGRRARCDGQHEKGDWQERIGSLLRAIELEALSIRRDRQVTGYADEVRALVGQDPASMTIHLHEIVKAGASREPNNRPGNDPHPA
jgi:hypothetical protein